MGIEAIGIEYELKGDFRIETYHRRPPDNEFVGLNAPNILSLICLVKVRGSTVELRDILSVKASRL